VKSHGKRLWSQGHSACRCRRQKEMAHQWPVAQARIRRGVRYCCSSVRKAAFLELLGCHRPTSICVCSNGRSERACFPAARAALWLRALLQPNGNFSLCRFCESHTVSLASSPFNSAFCVPLSFHLDCLVFITGECKCMARPACSRR